MMFLSYVLSELLLHLCQVLSAANFKQDSQFGGHVWVCHLRNNGEWSRNEDLLSDYFGKPQGEGQDSGALSTKSLVWTFFFSVAVIQVCFFFL